MKNKFILLCAATVALAACAKTEVTPEVPEQDAEITFITAPVTKASTVEFSTGNVFKSAAFYDYSSFAYGSTTAEEFIKPSVVKYFTSVWRATADDETTAKSYYWPKDGGKLTFFSWSLNKNSLTFTQGTPTVSITSDNGVKVENYSSLKNDDFMVADIQKDKTANEGPTYKTTGVPTLFRHKTSQFIVKVRTKDDYTVDPYKQVFTIDEINFIKLGTEGSYTQNDETWTLGTVSADPVEFYKKATAGQVVNYKDKVADAEAVTPSGTYLYIPQKSSADQKLQVKYTVSRTDKNNNVRTSSYTAEKSLSDLGFSSFAAGTKYIITLTFALDEILWDPAIQEWADGDSKTGTVSGNSITVEQF